MTKTLKALAIAVVVTAAAACSSQRAPAEMAVNTMDTAVEAAMPEIQKYAQTQAAGITAAVDAVKQKLSAGDYAGVLTDVPGVTTLLSEATQAAASAKASLTTEWASFASVPTMVTQVTAKIAEVTATRRMPRGMTQAKVDEAKASLDTVNGLWEEAASEFSSDNLNAAISKAREAKALVEPLMSAFGLSAAM